MDKDKAREELTRLRDSLNEVLGSKGNSLSKADAEKAVVEAKKGVKRLRKSLLERVKDLPVINQATQLGAAGSVAVATAAVTQTNIAVDETEILVASVANDVVENRFQPPSFIDRFVDFSEVNAWGQGVMQEKVESVKQEMARTEAKIAPTSPDKGEGDTQGTPEPQKDAEEPSKAKSVSIGRDKSEEETKDEEPKSEDKESKSEEPKSEEKESNEESKQETPKDNKARIEKPEVIPEEEVDDIETEGPRPGSDLIFTPYDMKPNSPAS